MKKISQLGILLLGLLLFWPLQAQSWEDEEMEELIEKFLKDKHVTITKSNYAFTKDYFTDLPKDSVQMAEFVCKGEKPLNQLVKAFEEQGHWAELYRSYEGIRGGATLALMATIGPKGMGERGGCDLHLLHNTRVLVYKVSADGLQLGFVLQWDDLPKGERKGFIYKCLGYDMEIVTVEQEINRVTMDSVRTAIKVGETVKNNPQQEIDTTYIDGKWAVSAKYHRDVLRAMDHISDYQDGFPAIANKINELVELSKTASEAELASIGFALKREASRYERLLTPEEFALIWKGLLEMQTYAKNAISDTRAGRYPRKVDPRILEYIKVSESILKSKANMSVRLQYHDTKRHQFLRDIGFTVTKNDGGRWYFAVSGKHYTGNPELEYLDACADEDGVLQYHAEHKETNLWPGIYRLTAAGRTSYQGEMGAFIFAKTGEELLLKEIPACDDRGGDIWRDAAIRVKEADEKHEQISPNDVRIALANGGMGYGWSKIVIGDIVVRDGTLTYGVSCDQDFTGTQFKGRWLSAVDFVLERVGDLPKE